MPEVEGNFAGELSSQRRVSPLLRSRGKSRYYLDLQFGWYRGGTPSSLLWMRSFFVFLLCHCERPAKREAWQSQLTFACMVIGELRLLRASPSQ